MAMQKRRRPKPLPPGDKRYDDIRGQAREMATIVALQDEIEVAPHYLRIELHRRLAAAMERYRRCCGRGWVE